MKKEGYLSEELMLTRWDEFWNHRISYLEVVSEKQLPDLLEILNKWQGDSVVVQIWAYYVTCGSLDIRFKRTAASLENIHLACYYCSRIQVDPVFTSPVLSVQFIQSEKIFALLDTKNNFLVKCKGISLSKDVIDT